MTSMPSVTRSALAQALVRDKDFAQAILFADSDAHIFAAVRHHNKLPAYKDTPLVLSDDEAHRLLVLASEAITAGELIEFLNE